ncbi:MAG: hypothetical protein MUF00_09110, partial [Gemmatimonadaceae bacterium]|nr:hypothetical protein [Gemmatimonadaceae bacterium]
LAELSARRAAQDSARADSLRRAGVSPDSLARADSAARVNAPPVAPPAVVRPRAAGDSVVRRAPVRRPGSDSTRARPPR